MMRFQVLLLSLLAATSHAIINGRASCPDYSQYSTQTHQPLSTGKYQLSYQRPDPACRKYVVPEVEAAINDMKGRVKDPDLFRLFENAFPNTLDTTISWKGYASNSTTEELTFITTGDIVAMWLRDSANQMRSYKSLLKANTSTDSLAGLFRGAINLQARYIIQNPYCNSFQAPPESGLPPQHNGAADTDNVSPSYSSSFVFECKYELDSISAFLQLSSDYYEKTQDAAFFGKFKWTQAVQTILNVAQGLLVGTYADDGSVNTSPVSRLQGYFLLVRALLEPKTFSGNQTCAQRHLNLSRLRSKWWQADLNVLVYIPTHDYCGDRDTQ
ncbi:hypothetical protein F4860DRAFT_23262 [Xylaria cubensis]|nr:hypothetical protein F4860DRAFT_23262 [Xylaria cubensis]